MTDAEIVQVQFTADSPEIADSIVRHLLDGRLIACGQRIGPVVSRYWWKGTQETSEEWLVIVKTTATLASAVSDSIGALHPYETPEILIVPVVGGNAAYREWIEAETMIPG